MTRGLFDGQAPGGQARWTRTNHRGEPVSLLEGPSVAAGLVAGGLVGATSARSAAALTVATAAGAAFGLADDLGEDAADRRKGLRGHLGALAHGQVTTGGLKVLGIGQVRSWRPRSPHPRTANGAPSRRLAGGRRDVRRAIAASANLVNLLDLRPGRALKAVGIAAAPLAFGPGAGAGAAAAVLGASDRRSTRTSPRPTCWVTAARTRSARRSGRLSSFGPRPVRLAVLAVVVGLTVASEKVSFTRVIERTPVLRDLDAWGRRPVDAQA